MTPPKPINEFSRQHLIVLLAGTVGTILSIPGQTMGVSVYTQSLMAALTMDDVELSLAYLCGTVMSSFLLPYAGRLIDRLGERRMAMVVFPAFALALLWFSYLPEIAASISPSWQEYQLLINFTLATLTFLLIRHLGQGQLTIISRAMIGKWFTQNRGQAFAISGTLVSFGFGVAPAVLNYLVETFTWQGSLRVLAAILAAGTFLAWWGYRNPPPASEATATTTNDVTEAQPLVTTISLAEAKKRLDFWLFNAATALHALVITAFTFHIASIAKLAGMTTSSAFAMFLPMAAISTIVNLGASSAIRRLNIYHLLIAHQLLLGGALFTMTHLEHTASYWLTVLLLGAAGGLFVCLVSLAWPQLYGTKHLGAIVGYNASWLVFASAIGPYAFSLGRQLTGDFDLSARSFATISATIIGSTIYSNRSRHRSL